LRFPISQIKVINGKAQVIISTEVYEAELEICFINGQESFMFEYLKEAQKWADAISQLRAGNAVDIENSISTSSSKKTKDPNFAGLGATIGVFAGGPVGALAGGTIGALAGKTVGALSDTLGKKAPEIPARVSNEKVARKCTSCGAPISGIKEQIVRCQYCDADQQL
jgi:hypothetical protein